MNPISAVTSLDPRPYYDQLARDRPFSFHADLGFWVAASQAASNEVLSHPHCLVRPRLERVPKAFIGTPVGHIFEQLARTTEGVHHDRARAFVIERIRNWTPQDIARAVDDVWPLLPQTTHAAMWSLPVSAIARLLGLSPLDAISMAEPVAAFAAAIAPGAAAELLESGNRGAAHLWHIFELNEPSPLVIANTIGIMSQACEAAAGYIGTGAPSVQNTRRFVDQDITIQQVPVPAGASILVLLVPAQLPFGAGRHRCPGEQLATLLATEALKRLALNVRYQPSLNIRIPIK